MPKPMNAVTLYEALCRPFPSTRSLPISHCSRRIAQHIQSEIQSVGIGLTQTATERRAAQQWAKRKQRKGGPSLDRSSFPLKSCEVEAIEVHHLAPGGHEVTHERLLRIAACIHLRQRPQLRVRTEDEIDDGARPPELAGRPIASLQRPFRSSGLLPLRLHVEEIHEEIIGEYSCPLRENAKSGLPEVCIQCAQATDQHRHLRSGQRQKVRPVHQQLSRRS